MKKTYTISQKRAKELKLNIITRFCTRMANEPGKHKIYYNHFKFIEKERQRINSDPSRRAYVVRNKLGCRALGVNPVSLVRRGEDLI